MTSLDKWIEPDIKSKHVLFGVQPTIVCGVFLNPPFGDAIVAWGRAGSSETPEWTAFDGPASCLAAAWHDNAVLRFSKPPSEEYGHAFEAAMPRGVPRLHLNVGHSTGYQKTDLKWFSEGRSAHRALEQGNNFDTQRFL